ncbi:2-oxoglutarate dehydrogenase, E2 component, dihydrolipoamide succinyltransferase [Enemella sp. A6]|uniref:2-oxoglutarate dehydrogenase, E2 component, dihydrolipoamide succinyltransferase n=1 Tax=Enemella sp. A6 TaxID=3440152 RepID=UPI003EB6C4C0
MPTSVELPQLGESVTEGTISRWLKQVGDTVEVDEPLVEISTDKVDTEIPSPVAGTVLEIKAAEDETVEVGAVLAIVGDADEAPADDAPAQQEPAAEEEAPAAEEPAQEAPAAEAPAAESSGQASSGQASSGQAQGTDVELPALGESVTEGTVSRWLKQVGDSVEVDEPLVEISTDKVDTEIPSPVAGTVLEIRVGEDETVEVGAVLAVVGDGSAQPAAAAEEAPQAAQAAEPEPEPVTDEKVEEQAADGDEGGQDPVPAPAAEEAQPRRAAEQEAPKQAPAKAAPAPKVAPKATGDDASYVTPLVRKLADQHGVDLAKLSGTGVGGRIRKQDVLAAAEEAKKAAEKPAEAPAAAAKAPVAASSQRGTTEKMSRLRQTIATRMVDSLQISAQLTATVEVDLTEISRIRKQVKDDFRAREGVGLTYLSFITKAVIEGLKQFPKLNATIDTEAKEVTFPDAEHIGIAVDTDKGLLVPVIRDAGDLSVAGLAKKIADLGARTRENKVTPDELSGGTFTITNYGSVGTLMDTPILNQPQVGILGTGALVKRAVVMDDAKLGETIAVRDMMYLSLTYDHRLVDGADAGRFLAAVKERLEEGDFGAEFGL